MNNIDSRAFSIISAAEAIIDSPRNSHVHDLDDYYCVSKDKMDSLVKSLVAYGIVYVDLSE